MMALHTPQWYRTATRWIQLTFAENDPQTFDPRFWIDLMRAAQANALCLSAGGYIAYYPTKVPYHYRSRYLEGTDPFGALVRAARDLGMHVMARVDPHAIHGDAAEAHPEWVARSADGQPRAHWSFPGIWVTCPLGSYNRDVITAIAREVVRDYDVDAIFANRWSGHGVCYCAHCRATFAAETGMEIPPERTPVSDPRWRAFARWRRSVLGALVDHWDRAVKDERPHASFIPNLGPSAISEFDRALVERHYPILFVDHQGRQGFEAPWAAGRNAKRSRGTFRDRPMALITSVGHEDPVHRWKDSVTTADEIKLWIADGFAQGARPWVTKFNSQVPDRRWVQPVIDAFGLHARLEPALGAMCASAEIGLLDPSTTLRDYPWEDRAKAEHHELGFYQALIEARLAFEMVSDQALQPAELDRFKVVALANAALLSDAQCDALRAYVGRGGSLVAAYETSLYDENGARRGNFGLADVLGASLAAPPRGPLKNTYVALDSAHPICAGFDGAQRIIGGSHLVDVALVDGESPLTYVPDFPDLPMEEVYPRAAPRGAALVARRTAGGGRVVYIPWNIGAIFWEVLAADHARLIGNAVRWALGTEPRVQVAGAGMIDLAVLEGDTGLAVVIANLTNPMTMRGAVRAIQPIGRQTVSIRLPERRTVREAMLLVAGTVVPHALADGRVIVDVPGVDLLEVVCLAWSGA